MKRFNSTRTCSFNSGVLGLGGALFAGVVGVSTLLFLLIPRFQLESSMFLDRIISKKAKSPESSRRNSTVPAPR